MARAARRAPAATASTWAMVISAVTLSFTPSAEQLARSRRRWDALGVGDRDLDVDVVAPRGDQPGLADHLAESSEKTSNEIGSVGDGLEDLAANAS